MVKKDIDVRPFLAEIAALEGAWELNTGRRDNVTVQTEAAAIPLRGLRVSRLHGRRRRDVHESRATRLAARFPAAMAFLERTALEQDAELGRARLVRLPGGSRVYPHIDRGGYYLVRDRYHLVLRSPEGSHLRAGGEEVHMHAGELWWFDNKQVHEAENPAGSDRIHLIFDLLPRVPSRRRSPAAPLTGIEGEELKPAAVLAAARRLVQRHHAEAIQQAVRLYLAGCAHVGRWQRPLERRGFDPAARNLQPLRATVGLVLGETTKRQLSRSARSMAWSLERIEAGHLRWDGVADAIVQAGGVRAVARQWKMGQAVAETTG